MPQQDFTASGTFTVPSNILSVTVELIGGGAGGGAGGGTQDATDGGRGYGGGDSLKSSNSKAVTPGDSYSIVIGTGGGGGPGGGDNHAGYPGTAGTPSTGLGFSSSTLGVGGAGGFPNCDTCGGSTGTNGEASEYGAGGIGGPRELPGSAPLAGAYGAGGGGGGGAHGEIADPESGLPGGAGAPGYCRILWDDFIEDGGLLINGSVIPEGTAPGGNLNMKCLDTLGQPFDGNVHTLMLDGVEVWRKI